MKKGSFADWSISHQALYCVWITSSYLDCEQIIDWKHLLVTANGKSVLILNIQEVGIFSKGIYSNFVQLDMCARDETQRCFEGTKDQGGDNFLDDGEKHAKSWKDQHPSSPLFQPSADISFPFVQENPLSLPSIHCPILKCSASLLICHHIWFQQWPNLGESDSCWYKILTFFLNPSGWQDCMNNAVRRVSVMCLSA